MNWVQRYHRLALMAASLLVSLLTGCGASSARFKPTSDEARSSLEAALTAWRDGKPYGSVVATPPIQVGDSAWQAGDQVESFEIGEELDDDGTKQFVVAFKMKKPPGDQSVRYYVHGRDPVWIYREDDYKRMLNMDNNPVTTSPSKSKTRRSGGRR
jgi:hypothetical protein